MCFFLCSHTHNIYSTLVFSTLLTHTEVWTLLRIVAVSFVTEFVKPVMFGCYEEIPRQQGANAQQKKDHVHQTVRVLWTVAYGQRHWGMSWQKWCRRTLVLALLILRYVVVTRCIWNIWGVQTGRHTFCAVHFHRQNKGDSQGRDERKRSGGVNQNLWMQRRNIKVKVKVKTHHCDIMMK